MLAYVFWHRPHEDTAAYRSGLVALHASLRASPSPGFVASASFARAELPWFDGYEDWYLVEDWTALGVLKEAAYRSAAHDPVADRAAVGAGAVFELQEGTPDLGAVRHATYSDEPAAGDVTWRRQLNLGPAPQYLAHHSAELGGEGAPGALQRRVQLVDER